MTEADKDKIEARYRAGDPVRDIADSLGVTPGALYATIRERALPHRMKPRTGPPLRKNVERDRAIAKAYAGGARTCELMSQWGLSRARIGAILRAAKVQRPRGRP